jgi:hypothetical protein
MRDVPQIANAFGLGGHRTRMRSGIVNISGSSEDTKRMAKPCSASRFIISKIAAAILLTGAVGIRSNFRKNLANVLRPFLNRGQYLCCPDRVYELGRRTLCRLRSDLHTTRERSDHKRGLEYKQNHKQDNARQSRDPAVDLFTFLSSQVSLRGEVSSAMI